MVKMGVRLFRVLAMKLGKIKPSLIDPKKH